MANKKNDDVKNAKEGCLALIALSVLILLATVFSMLLQLVPLVIPVVFLILFIVNWYRYKNEDKPHLRNGFWLSEDDMNNYSFVSALIERAKSNRSDVQAAVRNEGIRINKDGRISAKSYRGQNLRNTLESANATIDEYFPVKSHLEGLPQKRWKAARKHYSKYKGFRLAVIVWALFMLFTTSDTFSGFGQYVKGIGDTGRTGMSMVVDLWDDTASDSLAKDSIAATKPDKQQESPAKEEKEEETGDGGLTDNFQTEFAVSLWRALFLMIVIYFVTRFIMMFVFSFKYKKPPFVDMGNVFEYNVRYEDKPRKKAKNEQKSKSGNSTKEKAESAENTEEREETEKSIAQPSEPQSIEKPQRTKEREMFASWADQFKQDGYTVGGNWDNWDNSGDWKNLAISLTIGGIRVNGTIEYYTKGKQLYYGIQKADENDEVSQTLLNSDAFKGMMNELGMFVKNDEWWYCLKHVSFDDAFPQYKEFIDYVNKLDS